MKHGIRTRFAFAFAVAMGAAALATAGVAFGSGPSRTEHFTFMSTAAPTGETFSAIATGAFTDGGTATLLTRSAKLKLRRGTIDVSTKPGQPVVRANTKTCYEHLSEEGTYKIVGGTGTYRGIKGSGKFSRRRQAGRIASRSAVYFAWRCANCPSPFGSTIKLVLSKDETRPARFRRAPRHGRARPASRPPASRPRQHPPSIKTPAAPVQICFSQPVSFAAWELRGRRFSCLAGSRSGWVG